MPYIVKSWCVHPCHDIINPITGQNKFSKAGPNPTHPLGKYRLDSAMAADINRQYSLITASSSKSVSEGDKICTSCWKKISEQELYNDNEHMYVDNTNTNWVNSNNDNNNYNNDNHNNYDKYSYNSDNTDDVQLVDDAEDLRSSQEKRHTKEEAKQKMNMVFESLNIPVIRDVYVGKLLVFPIPPCSLLIGVE